MQRATGGLGDFVESPLNQMTPQVSWSASRNNQSAHVNNRAVDCGESTTAARPRQDLPKPYWKAREYTRLQLHQNHQEQPLFQSSM